MQTAIDCQFRYAWVRLYPSKPLVTAEHLMNGDVIQTFEEHGGRIETVLSDNGREFCGRPGRHPTGADHHGLLTQRTGNGHYCTVWILESTSLLERRHVLHATALEERDTKRIETLEISRVHREKTKNE